MNEALVELGFILVILKIPVVYLCLVVWWAVRAEPRPLEDAVAPAAGGWEPPGSGRRRRRPRNGPHGGPVRRYARRPVPRRVTAAR